MLAQGNENRQEDPARPAACADFLGHASHEQTVRRADLV